MGGYLIPEIIKVDRSSWSRKLLSKVGLAQRKYEKVNLQDKLIEDIRDKRIITK